jgi:hypothetical protein
MKINKYESNRFGGITEPITRSLYVDHDSRSRNGDAFKEFHRGSITRPTGEQRTVFLTPVAILGFVAMMLFFLWILVNVI